VATLTRILRCPGSEATEESLLQLAAQASTLYRPAGRKRKSDGTIREIFDAKFPLKTVQGRIQNMILKKVRFPEYLQGSIKCRGQGSNARKHVGRRFVITEDVEYFFPATSEKVVFEIWHRFFCFPPDVAQCLTKLTTKDGSLPQGAKTSPIAGKPRFLAGGTGSAAGIRESRYCVYAVGGRHNLFGHRGFVS
jgi:hypothetical protein